MVRVMCYGSWFRVRALWLGFRVHGLWLRLRFWVRYRVMVHGYGLGFKIMI